MSASITWVVVPLVIYVLIVVGVGLASTKAVGRSPEEYFLAGRKLGTLVLFMALFGTNTTAFVLVGIPGKAYHDGVAVFGVNAPIIALGIPLTFWAIGSPARVMGHRLGALTPAELYRKRFDSSAVGYVLFAFHLLYTLPYMVTAVKGASVTLTGVTGGSVPEWAGALGVIGIALFYTTLGGMRATAWTNVVQGLVFLAFMVSAFFFMSDSLGGLAEATARVKATNPALLEVPNRGLYTPAGWTSWGFAIALTVIAFPHMLVRLMAGESESALRGVCRLYPLALIVLWIPAVMIGVWGAAAFPGLEKQDQIFAMMAAEHLPSAMAPLGFVAVLAAVMSTLDAQILTLSSMLVRDVLGPLSAKEGETTGIDETQQVRAGRWFGLFLAVALFGLSMTWGQSVFQIAAFAFSGYVMLVPTLFFGVRWRRFTARAAISSIVVGNFVLFAATAGHFPLLGFLPVFWGFMAATVTALVVTHFDEAPAPETLRRAFG